MEALLRSLSQGPTCPGDPRISISSSGEFGSPGLYKELFLAFFFFNWRLVNQIQNIRFSGFEQNCFLPGGTGSWVRLCLCLCLFFFLGGWICIRRHCSGNWRNQRKVWVSGGSKSPTPIILLNELGTDLDRKTTFMPSDLPICLLPPQEGTHRASMEAESSQHGPCDRIERATKNRGFLNEGAEAAVIMGTWQINHSG